MTRVFITGWLVFFLVLCAIGVKAAHATTNNAAPTIAVVKSDPEPIEWPDSPCNLEHRMDVAIVGGLFFECQCMRLMVGYVCDWQIIAGVESPAHRRIKRHAKNRHAIGTAVISVKRVAA